MKSIPFLAVALLITAAPVASAKDCCRQRRCQPCGGNRVAAVQWYKAKDGTLREKIPYMRALSRAEDADDMEIALRGVEEELAAATEAATAQAAEIAALKKQLEEQVAATAAATDRATRAEAKVAEVTASLEKSVAEAGAAATARDEAKAALAKANEQVSQLTAEKEKLAAEISNTTGEIERLKQEAVESKKVAVATEDYDADPPKGDDSKEEAPAEEEPAEEPKAE